MDTIIIEPQDSATTDKIKNFLKELGIEYKTKKKKKDKPYNPEFVKMILERAESARQGNVVEIDPNDLWGSLGLK